MKYKINDIGQIVCGGTPSTSVKEYWDNEIVWLTPKDLSINKSKYTTQSSVMISQKGYQNSSAKLVPINTVLMSSRAPIGYLTIAKTELCTNQGFKAIICNEKIINHEFLYYLLQTKVEDLKTISTGSTFLELSTNTFKNYEIEVPDLQEQQHIVNILGSIDDKIENNEKKCIDLEHLMLKNFSVFYLKLSKYTKTTISEYFDISIGRTPPRKEFQWFEENINKNNMKWISISDMGNINTFIFNTAENLTLEAINKFNIPIIPENTVILSFKLTVGRVAITTEKMLSNEAIAHFKTDNKIIVPYLYAYLKNYNFNKLGNTSSIATATNSTAIKNMIFNVPSDQELIDFYKRNQPILDNILSIQKQNIKLNKLKQLYLKKFFG